MKKQVTWSWLLLCIFLFAACEKPVLESSDSNKKSKEKNKLTRVIRILPKELSVETFEESMGAKEQPFTRAGSTSRFYAINVYEKKPNDEGYSMYAYGLFTSLSKIALKMNVESLYKVECLIVEEKDDKLFVSDGVYSAPFFHGNNYGTKATNSFVFSKEENFTGLKAGATTIADGKVVNHPRVVKLYGTVSNFSPKATNTLPINMRRAVFGLHFKITPPEEGKLTVSYLGWYVYVTKASAAYENRKVYSFDDIEKGSQEGYQTQVDMQITWTKDDGTNEKETKQVVLKRNVMTVIEIKVEGQKPHGFTFNEESGDMKTENVEWNLIF